MEMRAQLKRVNKIKYEGRSINEWYNITNQIAYNIARVELTFGFLSIHDLDHILFMAVYLTAFHHRMLLWEADLFI